MSSSADLESEPYHTHRIRGDGVDLNVLEVGEPGQPTVILVHGLRDTAHALVPLAQHLSHPAEGATAYRCLITELRGHGASQRSDAYGMPNFLLDLHAVAQALTDGQFALIGHSLGGHITSRYAALFGESVKALITAEGLGPPHRPQDEDPAQAVQLYRNNLLSRLGPRESQSKAIPDLDDVVRRLTRNNPRLDPTEASRLAPYLVEASADGLRWAFDSRASGVFIGSSTGESQRYWSQVAAPTCVISGRLSFEYWGQPNFGEGFSGHFAEGEMEARAQVFPNSEHHWFDHSGHMIHYDEPERLAQLCQHFLEQHHV